MEGVVKNFLFKTLLGKLYIIPLLTLVAIITWYFCSYSGDFRSLWLTNNQDGYLQYKKKAYKKAALLFTDKAWKAASFYRDHKFARAAKLYKDVNTSAGYYNMGNAYTMYGQYYYGVQAYDEALKKQPDLNAAKENRKVAETLLKEKMKLAQQEGVKNPDSKRPVGLQRQDNNKIKKNPWQKKKKPKPNAKVTVPAMALWLDRLHTTPKDFLKQKFSYQYSLEKKGKNEK